MSTFPGLQAVIAGVIGKHYPGDPALPAAIAREPRLKSLLDEFVKRLGNN